MTNPGRILVAAVLGGALLVGCGGSTEDVQFPSTTAMPVPSDVAPQGGSFGEVAAQGMGDAVVRMCEAERRTLEVATEAYTVLNGQPPQSVDDLVGDWIREAPVGFTVSKAGAVRAVDGGPCA